MARKPNRMYRLIRGQATTRKEYMGGIPNPRITQFDLGNKSEKFPMKISLLVDEACHIRHSALESARISANRVMEKGVGTANYHLKIRVYPHSSQRKQTGYRSRSRQGFSGDEKSLWKGGWYSR